MTGNGDFKVVTAKTCCSVRDLCMEIGVAYSSGCGYYELVKRESIPSGKDIVACKMAKKASFVHGAEEVRNLLGLGHGSITVSRKDVKEGWALFVQSTSNNRKLPVGSTVLLRCRAAAAAFLKRPASQAAIKRPAAMTLDAPPAKRGKATAVKFPIRWDMFPGDGDGYIEAGERQLKKQLRYVDEEVDDMDKARFDKTLADLGSAAKAASWTADGSQSWVAPGGFALKAHTDGPEDYAIGLQTPQHSLVVGNFGCHPFVELEWMWFGNSDGSTFKAFPKAAMKSPNALVKKAVTDAKTFVYQQEH